MDFLMVLLVLISQPTNAQSASQTVGFKQAIEVFYKTPVYQSFDNDIKSIVLDFESRDLVLQPTLELSAARTHEYRELLFRSTAVRPRSDLLNLSLEKPFSTGTWLQFNTTLENAITPSLAPGHQDLAEWQVVLSQNLWKNSFGHATRLRWSREDLEKKQELASILKERAQVVVDFENLYWDWALILKEAELQKNNLKRGQEILRWVQDRLDRAAAERTDYLNAKALLARRELQVSAIQQRVTQALARFERYIPQGQWRPDPKDLTLSRQPELMISDWIEEENIHPTPLEYLALANQAEAQKIRAKEVRDSIRPELNLEASYGKNAIDPITREALSRSYSDNNEISSIGIVYRTGLDFFGERKLADSAKRKSEALLERKEAFEAEAKISWAKFTQELKDLQAQIDQAEELVKIQTQKSNAEKVRYRKGRSTAFEAITYEQEVAESEILLWSLYALKRKTEARARLFAR